MTKVPIPPPFSPLSSSSAPESSSEEDFSSDASSEAPPIPELRRTKNYSIPRRHNVQSAALSLNTLEQSFLQSVNFYLRLTVMHSTI